MEDKKYDARKLPLMNNAIPGTVPRSWLHTRFEKKVALLGLGLAAIVAAPFASIDYNYQMQAREIHHAYTTKISQQERRDDEEHARLTVYEELRVLRQEGRTPKSWAVNLLRVIGTDYYVTSEGFVRK